MKSFLSGLFFAALVFFAPAPAGVMLAGGHLPLCTSFSPGQCMEDQDWSDTALLGHRFRIDSKALERWAQADLDTDRAFVRQWLPLLQHLADDYGPWLERVQLTARIRSAELTFPEDPSRAALLGEDLYQAADDRQWQRLFDHLQQAVSGQAEEVRLRASRNADAVVVFERFVAMAAAVSKRERPRIAVSTASSRDPYDALDFYLQLFEQAGAEVVWLPLDAAVRAARESGHCDELARFQASELGSFDRQRVWPEHFADQLSFCRDPEQGLALVDSIDGLFLNGGDQWLTLHAFRNREGQATPELERVLARLDARDMVLGGTSAGAAVQSGADMVSNGSNRAALLHGAFAAAPPPSGCQRTASCPEGLSADSLTFHPPGGLGSAPFAIVDTHFSERQRQLRLSRLLQDAGRRFGIGVDETTALIIETPASSRRLRLEVVGAAAAWLMDRYEESAIQLHRLSPGAALELDLETLPLALSGPALSGTPSLCSSFDWSVSFNALTEALTEFEPLCWRMAPAPEQHFLLQLRVLSARPGWTIFDWSLEPAE